MILVWLSTFVTVHVIISLIGLCGRHYRHVRAVGSQPDAGPDRRYSCCSTILTSATGF